MHDHVVRQPIRGSVHTAGPHGFLKYWLHSCSGLMQEAVALEQARASVVQAEQELRESSKQALVAPVAVLRP